MKGWVSAARERDREERRLRRFALFGRRRHLRMALFAGTSRLSVGYNFSVLFFLCWEKAAPSHRRIVPVTRNYLCNVLFSFLVP